MDLWVVGASGLLGSAVVRHRPRASRLFVGPPVPWSSADAAAAALQLGLDQFMRFRSGGPWAVLWAAGTGVVASSPSALAAQGAVMATLARGVADQDDEQGRFVFASSTSVFGPVTHRPHDERDEPSPRGAYAVAKADQERELVALFSSPRGPRLDVARISTLYGPGQDLAKPQGLVTKMCLEAVTRGVVPVFVPLDTTRDYLYVDDAARMIHHVVGRPQTARTAIHVCSADRPTTIGELARTVQSVLRRRTYLRQFSPGRQSQHANRLLARSTDDDLRALATTSLPVGVHAVAQDVIDRAVIMGLGGSLPRDLA